MGEVSDETQFLAKNLDAERVPELDSETVVAYRTSKEMASFDRDDGHLAVRADRKTGRLTYICEHVRRGFVLDMLMAVGGR